MIFQLEIVQIVATKFQNRGFLDMIAFLEMLERHNEQIGKATTFQSIKSLPIGAIDFNF